MKRKEKGITILGLSVLICSLFLVAIPVTAIASEQDDYILGIYGNANEDDIIDMRDLTYVKLIFFGKKSETELADAKYDGKINPLDFIQIKLIIVGKEKELTVIDSKNRIVTVKKPIKRIIPFSSYVTEVMQSLKATDKIVAVPDYVTKDKKLFPELVDLPCVGNVGAIDYEKIVEARPDLFFWYTDAGFDEAADKFESLLPSTPLVRISCIIPDIYIEDVRKIGYILDREDEAEEFIDFYKECLNQIDEKVETLSEDEKPRVFYTLPSYFPTYYTFNRLSGIHQGILRAGVINIAADIVVGPTYGSGSPIVDPEWVLVQNPEIIIGGVMSFGYRMGDTTEADMIALIDKIMLNPGWGHIAAVESGKVYLLDTKIVWHASHFIGTAYMAKLFHPELFDDLDPQAMHQEYLDRFQGLDFDVYEDGVFVYPPFE